MTVLTNGPFVIILYDKSIVTEYDWESDTWTHPPGEHAARAAWREAVQAIAERAKATLPEGHDPNFRLTCETRGESDLKTQRS